MKQAIKSIKMNPKEAGIILLHDMAMLLVMYIASLFFKGIVTFNEQTLAIAAQQGPILGLLLLAILIYVCVQVLVFSFFQYKIKLKISGQISFLDFYLANLTLVIEFVVLALIFGLFLSKVRPEIILPVSITVALLLIIFYYTSIAVLHTQQGSYVKILVKTWKKLLGFKYLNILGMSLIILLGYGLLVYLLGLLLNNFVTENNFALLDYVFKGFAETFLYVILYCLFFLNRYTFARIFKT